MTIPIVMPQLGESVAEGTVIEWLKQEGDRVQKDEAVLAISTEKVDAEIPAPASGVLSRILVKAGEAAPVGSVLAVITEGFASGTGIDLGSEAPVMVPPLPEPRTPNLEPRTPRREERFYSPAVRRLADELKVNLAEVGGSGEDGRVTGEAPPGDQARLSLLRPPTQRLLPLVPGPGRGIVKAMPAHSGAGGASWLPLKFLAWVTVLDTV